MPQFYTGETKTARVTMRNPTTREFSYAADLILGLPEAARFPASFNLPGGGEALVPFTVTLPQTAGSYPVHLCVTSGGGEVGLFRAAEDIDVVRKLLPFTMELSNPRVVPYPDWSYARLAQMDVRLTNPNPEPVTKNIKVMSRYYVPSENEWSDWVVRGTYAFTVPAASSFSTAIPAIPSGDSEYMIFLLYYNTVHYFALEDEEGNRSNEVSVSL